MSRMEEEYDYLFKIVLIGSKYTKLWFFNELVKKAIQQLENPIFCLDSPEMSSI